MSSVTDNFKETIKSDKVIGLLSRWRGVTIFQINADARKELGMVSSSPNNNLRPQPARNVAQHEKVQLKRQAKTER